MADNADSTNNAVGSHWFSTGLYSNLSALLVCEVQSSSWIHLRNWHIYIDTFYPMRLHYKHLTIRST